MNKQARSRKFTAKQSARLGAYLAAGLGAAATTTSTADAAIVNINIGPSGFDIGGVNAGILPGDFELRNEFPAPGLGGFIMGYQTSLGNPFTWTGIVAGFGSYFATDSAANATPTNFALNDAIDGSSYFSSGYTTNQFASVFKVEGLFSGTSPNFGPGSYMGFKTANNSFGWLEVTWDGAEFEILSGAYETDPGVAILAGQGAAVPEPGTWAAAALLAGGAAFARWRKRRDEAQKEAA